MCAAAAVSYGLGLWGSATAATPLIHTSTSQLDLRLPADSSRVITHGGGPDAPASAFFPSAIHHLGLGKPNLDTDAHGPSPGLGASELRFRTMSQAEIFARRVHREGLPIARLWESKSALLSIGLNQRGKLGLWLTQKTH